VLLLADVSLRDVRSSKRRKIEDGNKQVQPTAAATWSQPPISPPPCCSVCSQSVKVSSTTCPSCRNTVCNRCTGICDASILTAPQPPTPPLLADSDSASGSSPCTPNRHSTPEPLDPQLLRARLSAAAAAHQHSFSQSTNTIHSHGLTPSNQNATLYIGNTNILKKRKRMPCCATTTQGLYSDIAANVNVSRQQRLEGLLQHKAPLAFDSMYAEIDYPLCAPKTSSEYGCSVRLCLNCLVTTADGHKICFGCLEESFAC